MIFIQYHYSHQFVGMSFVLDTTMVMLYVMLLNGDIVNCMVPSWITMAGVINHNATKY